MNPYNKKRNVGQFLSKPPNEQSQSQCNVYYAINQISFGYQYIYINKKINNLGFSLKRKKKYLNQRNNGYFRAECRT